MKIHDTKDIHNNNHENDNETTMKMEMKVRPEAEDCKDMIQMTTGVNIIMIMMSIDITRHFPGKKARKI